MVAGVLLLVPDTYRSEAVLLPLENRASGGTSALASAAAAMGVPVPLGDAPDTNFMDILASRRIRLRLLHDRFAFQLRPWPFGRPVAMDLTLAEFLKARSEDDAVLEVGQHVRASRDMKTKVINITAETRSPELSRQLVQKTLQALESYLMAKGRTRGSQKAQFTSQRLGEARAASLEAETALRTFLEVNRNYQSSPDPSVRLKGTRLEAELRLRQTLVTNLALAMEQALLQEKDDMPILNVLDPPNLPINKANPPRTRWTFLAFLLGALGSWLWWSHGRIRAWLYPEPSGGLR